VTRGGSPIDALAAADGVAGGIPPAKVEMEYCWPHENSAIQKKTKRTRRLVITVT
jgi:hypothetical protein